MSFLRAGSWLTRGVKKAAVLIGGGTGGKTISRLWRQPRPEYSQYLDISQSGAILEQAGWSQENITIHWHDGTMAETNVGPSNVVEYCYQLDQLMNRAPALASAHTVAALPYETHPADFSSIASTFTKLAADPPSQLIVMASGHGEFYRGVVLHNQYLTRHTLSKDFLRKQFDKLPATTTITLLVNSCYSGYYLPLSQANVFITTSGSVNNPSFYQIDQATELPDMIEKIQQSDRELLSWHCVLSMERRNYTATDSFTYQVETVLQRAVGQPAWQRYLPMIQERLFHPKLRYVVSGATIVMIMFDPTGLVHMYYSCKLFLIAGKFGAFFLKLALPFWMATVGRKWMIRQPWYRERHLFASRRLLSKVIAPPTVLTEAETAVQIAIDQCSVFVSEIAIIDDVQASRYQLLGAKLQLYWSVATPEERAAIVALYERYMGT